MWSRFTGYNKGIIGRICMSSSGWLIMLVSVGFVTLLFAWCIYKVISTPDTEEHLHSSADIDTHDDNT